MNKFPDGLFSGLAKIKIAALTEAALLRRRPGDDGKIELAVLSDRYRLVGNDNYNNYTSWSYQSKEARYNAISEGMKMALAESRLFVPKWCDFHLENEYQTKRLDQDHVQKLIRLWSKDNPFQREEPKIDEVRQIAQQIDVEAILLTRQLITTAIVIPAQAGIQTITGSRIKSGMTKIGQFNCRFNDDQYKGRTLFLAADGSVSN